MDGGRSAGDDVRTAQTRLLLEAKVGGSGVLSGVVVNLPLYLELAYAEARLARVDCPPASRKVVVDVRPGVADLRIAAIDTSRLTDFTRNPVGGPAQIVKAAVIGVKGEAHVRVGNTNWSQVSFNASDIANAGVKSVATSSFAGSLAQSLTNDLDLEVSIAGIDLGLSGLVKATLGTVLTAAAPALDQAVGNVLAALGLRLGEADVRVHGLVCQRAVLVQ